MGLLNLAGAEDLTNSISLSSAVKASLRRVKIPGMWDKQGTKVLFGIEENALLAFLCQ